MSFINLFLVGILIGVAMIVPGLSGGVIAVIFGVYDKMIYSLTNIFKDFKKNFTFLLVLGVGILVGAVWFSNIMIFLYEKHEVLTRFSFIGLILGGVPFLFRKVKETSRINYFVFFATIVFCFLFFILSKNVFRIDLSANSSSFALKNLNLFMAGFIYSIGKVMPGISGSFLLITIGMYEYVLSVIAHPITIGLREINKLLVFLTGLIFGVFILLKIMNRLLKRKFGLVYSMIIGFVLGSIFALIPNVSSVNELVSGFVVFTICFILAYKLIK